MKGIKNSLTIIVFLILTFIGILFLIYRKLITGTILIILAFIGIITQIYILKKNIKTFSRSWINTNIFFLIITIVLLGLVRYFLFEKTIYLSDIIGTIVGLVAIYLYFKIIVPKYLTKR